MSYDELIKERPYLKEILELYHKLKGIDDIKVTLSGDMFSSKPGITDEEVREITFLVGRAFGLDEEDVHLLGKKVCEGKIPLREIPLRIPEMPALPFEREELEVILFLIARPYLRAEKERMNLDGIFWAEGRCPVCNGAPVLSFLEKEEKRRFLCSYCGTMGPWRRTGCPFCGSDTPEETSIITAENEKGMKIYGCNACKSYLKGFEMELLAEHSPGILDILSLPLDVIAQEKGFKRHAPNPLGMIKIS
jgi:FdhE protein